ncbi:MAG TPA: nucleotidyltransferase family protein [Pyrinomonadaceae bacterium]|nr:nucleotidyltransferase family protein [Pyrinomonadaceae bacterium]
MKLIVLGAGYATRLYPLTLDRPKPLLEVAGKPMVEHVLDNLANIEGVRRVTVVTNAKFAGHFERWAEEYRASREDEPDFSIINDGSTDDSNKLGAIGDLNLVLQREGADEDIVVVAGDNLFSDRLAGFVEFARSKDAPVLAVYDVGSLEEIKKYNAIETDAEGRITFFEEKPAEPKSTLTGIALYYYPKWSLSLIRQYVEEGNNPDQPGRLVQWMYERTPFYTWRVPGLWYDVGSKETLAEANRIFSDLKAKAQGQ